MLAKAQGITRRTLERAAQEIDVEHERRDFPSTTHWRLPSRAGGTPKGVAQLEMPHGYAESEPVAPVAPEGSAGVMDGATPPILGDPDHLPFVAGVHAEGQITTAEALDLERLHLLIQKTDDAGGSRRGRRSP